MFEKVPRYSTMVTSARHISKTYWRLDDRLSVWEWFHSHEARAWPRQVCDKDFLSSFEESTTELLNVEMMNEKTPR